MVGEGQGDFGGQLTGNAEHSGQKYSKPPGPFLMDTYDFTAAKQCSGNGEIVFLGNRMEDCLGAFFT